MKTDPVVGEVYHFGEHDKVGWVVVAVTGPEDIVPYRVQLKSNDAAERLWDVSLHSFHTYFTKERT